MHHRSETCVKSSKTHCLYMLPWHTKRMRIIPNSASDAELARVCDIFCVIFFLLSSSPRLHLGKLVISKCDMIYDIQVLHITSLFS